MQPITTFVRPEQPGDEPAIQQVHLTAFPSGLEACLVDELRSSARLEISLVVLVNGQLAGHIAFSPVVVGSLWAGGLGLAPVAVLPEFQRRGLGSKLIVAGLEECRRRGISFVVVLGDPAFYGRFGFVPAARWKLCDDFGGRDHFQAIELQPASVPVGGHVQYSAEFSVFK